MASRNFTKDSLNKRFPDSAVSTIEDFVADCVAMGSGLVGIISFTWQLGSTLVGIGQSGFALAKYVGGQNSIYYIAMANGTKMTTGTIDTTNNTVTINWTNT